MWYRVLDLNQRFLAYRARALTTRLTRHCMVDTVGFEPTCPFGNRIYSPGQQPVLRRIHNLVDRVGIEPTTFSL